MEALADLPPTEEHHGDERRLHKEGEDPFDSEGGTEDVTDEPAVVRPVGPELELEDDPRSYADSEVNPEELLPELRGLLPEFITAAIVLRLSQ